MGWNERAPLGATAVSQLKCAGVVGRGAEPRYDQQGGRAGAPDACAGPGPAGSHEVLRAPNGVGAARQGGGVPQLGGCGEGTLLSAGRAVGAQGVAVVPPAGRGV